MSSGGRREREREREGEGEGKEEETDRGRDLLCWDAEEDVAEEGRIAMRGWWWVGRER